VNWFKELAVVVVMTTPVMPAMPVAPRFSSPIALIVIAHLVLPVMPIAIAASPIVILPHCETAKTKDHQ
jgi:hypothetical protein